MAIALLVHRGHQEVEMRQKPGTKQSHGEKVVKDIRRATRILYSAEQKVRILLDGLNGEDRKSDCRLVHGLRGFFGKPKAWVLPATF
nr:hypothetical protein [Ruegeria atlantica]